MSEEAQSQGGNSNKKRKGQGSPTVSPPLSPSSSDDDFPLSDFSSSSSDDSPLPGFYRRPPLEEVSVYSPITLSPSSDVAPPISTPSSSDDDDDSPLPDCYCPLPLEDVSVAKEKAQALAIELFSKAIADKSKAEKAIVDNSELDVSAARVKGQALPVQLLNAKAEVPGELESYAHKPNFTLAATCKKIEIPNGRVGAIIGKVGETIKYLQLQSGAKIQVTRDKGANPNFPHREVELVGTLNQIDKAEQLINDVLSKNLARNQGMDGGYPRQGYQAWPPTSWAPHGGPMQQPDYGLSCSDAPKKLPHPCRIPQKCITFEGSDMHPSESLSNVGYGYAKPGAYPGPNPQYNISKPQYPCYHPQASSAGYASGWDQNTARNQRFQALSQAGGYDYYNQQAFSQQQQNPGGPAASSDTSAFGYNQQSALGYSQGQTYSQDGYGGYNAAVCLTGYQQPSPYPSYSQGYGHTGYGVPPTFQGGHRAQPAAAYGTGYYQQSALHYS